jgi:hypothetical protein
MIQKSYSRLTLIKQPLTIQNRVLSNLMIFEMNFFKFEMRILESSTI